MYILCKTVCVLCCVYKYVRGGVDVYICKTVCVCVLLC